VISILLNGFVLGWSVAWPPGPVNAEMIRRGLQPKKQGGGFWAAWPVGIGACIGDFTWAFAVSIGAGSLFNSPSVRRVLAIISLLLLILLAFMFARSAWRIFRTHRSNSGNITEEQAKRGGLLLGFLFAVSSPWNLGFWLAVIGSQSVSSGGVRQSLMLAAAVVLGALTWSFVLCTAIKFGARVFSRPEWQILTQALTAVVMLWFAVRLLLRFP
jgi:threonine/homoserine/homoserine lactone efflux protein